MNKKIVLNDDSGNPVEIDLKIFIDHVNHYHKTGTSIHEERGHWILSDIDLDITFDRDSNTKWNKAHKNSFIKI